jgi:hypothetical protein
MSKNGVQLITEERQRQIDEEGWAPEHDDKHSNFSLVRAAICYAARAAGIQCFEAIAPTHKRHVYQDLWPWVRQWDKRQKHGVIRCLTIAGALIAAEIDRVQREAAKKKAERALSGHILGYGTEA